LVGFNEAQHDWVCLVAGDLAIVVHRYRKGFNFEDNCTRYKPWQQLSFGIP